MNRKYELIAIGCSAGGIDALKTVLGHLKEPFAPTIVVVQHIAPTAHASIADLFREICALPVKEAEDKETISGGVIYFAPAGYHLFVEKSRTFALSVDSPVHFARPSIDVFMESAAEVYKERCAGFVLTGANNDGAEGLKSIEHAGGMIAVQNPQSAEFKSMPQAALQATETSFVFSLREIEDLITSLR
jgi:two-component system chemotaxis response regulator CheB